MEDAKAINSTRRAILGSVGAAAGLAITRAGDWFANSASDLSFHEVFDAFEKSLSPIQRKHTFLSSDHPARQVTLTEAVHKGPHIGTLYNYHQLALIREMYQQLLSSQGQHWMRNTINCLLYTSPSPRDS